MCRLAKQASLHGKFVFHRLPLIPTAPVIHKLFDGYPRKDIGIHLHPLGLSWRTEAVVCYP